MIRLIQHTDAQALFCLVETNRQYLRRWLPWLDYNKTIQDTADFIMKSLNDYAANRSMVHAIIEQDQIIGVCGFNALNHSNSSGMLGYWISKAMQGKGFAKSACRALEELGFGSINLNKIEIHVAEENRRSRAVAEKLGYIQTGRILDAEWLYDHYVDHLIYCKRKSDRDRQDVMS